MPERKTIHVPFAGGMDQKVASQWLDPTQRLASVQNGNFVKVNAVDKRQGMALLGNEMPPGISGASPTVGQRVVSWSKSDLTVMGSGNLYTTLSETMAAAPLSTATPLLTQVGALSPCAVRRRSVGASSYAQPIVVDFTGGRIVIYQDASFDFFATVLDAGGDVIVPTVQLMTASAGYFPYLVNAFWCPAASGQPVQIIISSGPYVSNASVAQTLSLITYSPTTNTFSASSSLISSVSLPAWDAVPYVNDPAGGYLVGYNASSTTITLAYFVGSTPGATQTITMSGTRTTWEANYVQATYGEHVWLAFQTINGSFVDAYSVAQFAGDHAFALVMAADASTPNQGAICTGIARLTANTLVATYHTSVNPSGITTVGLNTFDSQWLVWTAGTSTPTSTGYGPIGFVPVYRPFTVAGVGYQPCVYMTRVQSSLTGSPEASEQATLYLLAIGTNAAGQSMPVATVAKNVVATESYSTLQNYSQQHLCLTSTSSLTATDFACAVNTVGGESGAVSGLPGASFAVDFLFDSASQSALYQSQELLGELHVSGAVPMVFDGQTVAEDNFFHFPEFTYAVNGHPEAGPGLGTLPAGQYQYAVCYAFTDAAGLVHRSAPAYTEPITPSPQVAAVVVGTADLINQALYGANGTLNTSCVVTGSADVSSGSSLYGTNGALASPILIGYADVTNSALYGVGGTLDGLTLTLIVDSSAIITAFQLPFTPGGASLPFTPINVQSTSGFPSAGKFWIGSNNHAGGDIVTYTGVGAAQFTGCSGGTGTVIDGCLVVPYKDGSGNYVYTTLTLNGATNTANEAAFLAAIHTKWPQLTAGVVNSQLVLSSSSTGPTAVIIAVSYGNISATAALGFVSGQGSPAYTPFAATGVPYNYDGPLVPINLQGRQGAFTSTGAGYTFTDPTATFTASMVGAPLCVTGSNYNSNNSTFLIVGVSSSPHSVVVLPLGTSNPVTDTVATDAWAVFGNPPVRCMSMNVEGGGQYQLVLDGNTSAASQANLFAAITNLWPHITPTLAPSTNYLTLTINDKTGTAATLALYNDTASALLGLVGLENAPYGSGPWAGETTTLILNANAYLQTLTLDVTGNAATQSALIAAINAKWISITATVSSGGFLTLTDDYYGPGYGIWVGGGTANLALGLTTVGATFIASGSNGQTLPQSTIYVLSTAGFPSSGYFYVDGSLVSYGTITGGAAPYFGGCSGGTATLATGDSVEVGVAAGSPGLGGPVLHITNLAQSYRYSPNITPPPAIEIYRTTINGSVFFLLDTIPAGGIGTPELLYPSNGTTSDTTPDATLQSSSLIYTTGGVLPNINPPSFAIQITHNGRVVGIDETLQQVWPSQAGSPGTAPGFSGSLVIPFVEAGDATAAASMDGKFFLFKRSSIWAMFGPDGPSLTGQGSDWSVPQKLSTNVGAVSQAGIVGTDVGVFFQAPSGIYLLGRDLTVSFVGKNVSDTLAAYPTITSATLVPSATQVRWTCTNGSSGATIVYDYLLSQWAVHQYPYISSPVVGSCTDLTRQAFVVLDQSGKLWTEVGPSYFFDQDTSYAPHFVPTVITLAPIRTELQGHVQARTVQLITQPLDKCGLQIQMAVNYNGIVIQTSAWSYGQLSKSPLPGQVQAFVGAKYNQSMSYTFTVSDVDPGPGLATTGQGARFVALDLDVNVLGDRYPFIPVSNRA